jgi:hypothetical protein
LYWLIEYPEVVIKNHRGEPMTEAEIMEQISMKKTRLEQARSGNSDATLVKTLEDEIKQLEASLTSGQAAPKRPRRTAFLDECAG